MDQIDEVFNLISINNLIKDVVTCDVMPFEDKGIAPYSMRVFPNFILTSNEDSPIKIEDEERRWMAFQCSRYELLSVRMNSNQTGSDVHEISGQYLYK